MLHARKLTTQVSLHFLYLDTQAILVTIYVYLVFQARDIIIIITNQTNPGPILDR